MLIIPLNILKHKRKRNHKYLLFTMQQTYSVFGHFQFFGDDFFEIFHRRMAINADGKATASRRIDIQCDLR